MTIEFVGLYPLVNCSQFWHFSINREWTCSECAEGFGYSMSLWCWWTLKNDHVLTSCGSDMQLPADFSFSQVLKHMSWNLLFKSVKSSVFHSEIIWQVKQLLSTRNQTMSSDHTQSSQNKNTAKQAFYTPHKKIKRQHLGHIAPGEMFTVYNKVNAFCIKKKKKKDFTTQN